MRIEAEGNRGRGIGSGFLADSAGTLVTNTHVLAGAHKAVAVFPNGQQHEIKGTLLFDAAYDICIAKIDGTSFEFLPLAAELPRKGERVTALGSPKGLSFTATTGIISAVRSAEELGADIGRPEIRGTWIQVDAALSGGNSGGPLINDRGEVVAMSTLASQGSAQNLNFGISVNDIRAGVNNAPRWASFRWRTAWLNWKPPSGRNQGPSSTGRPFRKSSWSNMCRKAERPSMICSGDCAPNFPVTAKRCARCGKEKHFCPPMCLGAEVVRLILKKSTKYFFRSQGVKDREVSRLQTAHPRTGRNPRLRYRPERQKISLLPAVEVRPATRSPPERQRRLCL